MKGYISSIETMGLVDGPGIRVVFFLAGCKLRCIFCHNPETWTTKNSIEMTPSEVLDFILKYKNYFVDNGGVTFSGGEPLLQTDFLIEVLKLCKENDIHTCVDTAGVGNGNYEEVLKYTDLVMLDIKAIDEEGYKDITGKSMDEFYKFLEVLNKSNKEVWIRQVIIPGINDTKEYILKLKDYVTRINNVKKIELLPYHGMGIEKYKKLGLTYKLENTPDMDKKKIEELNLILNS